MRISREIIARAKQLRKEAAKKFGGNPEDYLWSECVSMAMEHKDHKEIISSFEEKNHGTYIGSVIENRETEKAVLVTDPISDNSVWLPKSQIKTQSYEAPEGKRLLVSLPVWLVEKNGWDRHIYGPLFYYVS